MDGYHWAFVGVYGPNLGRIRNLLWDELASLCSIWDLPLCIGGDFNVIQFPSERLDGLSFNPTMVEVSKFIFEQDLLYISLACGSFTWSSNRELPS